MILAAVTSSFAHDAEILCIGVLTHTTEHRIFTTPDDFLDYFLGTDDKIVVGFNILKLDIPLLLLATRQNSRFPGFFRKLNYSNIIDLFTILTFQNRGVIKGLDFYLEREGIGRPFPPDRDIAAGVRRGAGADGLKKKLEAVNALYWKMKDRGQGNGR